MCHGLSWYHGARCTMSDPVEPTQVNLVSALARCWIRGQLCVGVSLTQQGRELGVSHAALSKVKDRLSSCGAKLELALANKLFGGSRDKLLAAARKHWEADPLVRLPAVRRAGEPTMIEDSAVRPLPTKTG
jgi:hypothetical protein